MKLAGWRLAGLEAGWRLARWGEGWDAEEAGVTGSGAERVWNFSL